MTKLLFLLLLLVSCAKENSNLTQSNEPFKDYVVEGENLTFSLTPTGLVSDVVDNLVEFPLIKEQEVGQVKIQVSNMAQEVKTISLISSLNNFELSSTCGSSLAFRRSCFLTIKNKKLAAGVYNESFTLQGQVVSLKLLVSPAAPLGQDLVFSLNPIIENSLEFKIRSTGLKAQDLNLDFSALDSEVDVTSLCSSSLLARRFCVVNFKRKTSSVIASEKQASINGKAVIFTLPARQVAIPVLTLSVPEINVSVADAEISHRFLVKNLNSAPLAFSSSLPAGVVIKMTTCASLVSPRRACLVELGFSPSLAAGELSAVIGGKSLKLNITKTASPCALPGRISAEECEDSRPAGGLVKHTVNTALFPQAVCNDGSPAVYYIRSGSGSGASRWIINLEDGAFCGKIPLFFNQAGVPTFSVNSCPSHANSYPGLTSSVGAPLAYSYNDGILSSDPVKNPDFYSWNQIEIKYCSSDLWSGDSIKSINGSVNFNFRGKKIIEAVINDLSANYNLANAQSVILSGASAGGVGIINQGDWIKENFFATKDVAILSDSGFFVDHLNINGAPMLNGLFYLNAPYYESTVDQSCVPDASNIFSCYFGAFAKDSITTPKFFIQDQLDNFYLEVIDSVNLCQNPSLPWLANYTSLVRSSLTSSDGAISLRSGQHVFTKSANWSSPSMPNNASVSDLFSNWYFSRAGIKQYIAPQPSDVASELSSLCQ